MTLQVIYLDVDAPSEWDARVDGCSFLREELNRADLPQPDTIFAEVQED